MEQELIPVTGTALIFLISKLAEYFGPQGARDFCGLLQTTGSWVLGSFALMAVSQAVMWDASDIDIFVDYSSPSVFTFVALFTELLTQAGYRLQLACVHDYDEIDSVVKVLSFHRVLHARNRPRLLQKVQLILEKSNTSGTVFPLSVLRRFDVSCCCCAFDGVHLYQAAWNILPMFYTQHDKVKIYRVEKYQERGYSFLPDFGPDPIELQDDIDDNDAPAPALPAMGPIPPQIHPHVPPATCQVIIRRTKIPCGRLLIGGQCPIHK